MGRIVIDAGIIAVITRPVGVELIVQIAVRVIAFGLVIKALAELVHQDEVVPVLDLESRRRARAGGGGVDIPGEIVVPRAQGALRSDAIAIFQNLVPQTPERGANRHGGQLTTGVLERIGLAGCLIDLGQAGIEHAPEVDVAGAATGGHNHRFGGADGDARLGTVHVACGAVAL